MRLNLGIKRTANALKYVKKVYSVRPGKELSALLLCHALEKGMGIPNVKYGYGKEKADELIGILNEMASEGKTERYSFKESLAILKAYFAYQESTESDVSELKAKAKDIIEKYPTEYKGGYTVLRKEDLLRGTELDYESFVRSRHSMRTYSQEAITEAEVLKVISLAKYAPSACNREPWKFFTSLDKKKCQKIAGGLPQQSFLERIPYFGLVTVDKALFNSLEINQWYVNGGIFLGYLSAAFHSQGIGSCIFQFPVLSKSAGDLKELLFIPESEEIIAAVGYGKFADEAKCICADRRKDEDIAAIR